jgi:hypothetical protein
LKGRPGPGFADRHAETEALEVLNATGAMIAAELDQETLVQKVTDAGVALDYQPSGLVCTIEAKLSGEEGAEARAPELA